jgi:hypothetical protein
MAMEGLFRIFLPLIVVYFGTPGLTNLIYFSISHNDILFRVRKITINTSRNKRTRGIHTSSKRPYI